MIASVRGVRALVLVSLLAACQPTAEPSTPGEPGLLPGAVAATGWRDGLALVPAGFGPDDRGHASPDAIVSAMVARIREVGEPEPWVRGEVVEEHADVATASVFVPLPGFEDTTVGAELRLALRRDGDGWRVADAEMRFHCRVSVRGSLCG